MSELNFRFTTALEEKIPGSVTIIKVVEKPNQKITVGFGIHNGSTGQIIACDEEKGRILIELLHFLQDIKPNIKWDIVT